jgi:DNA adenine methylase
MSALRSPLRRVGGKFASAERIINAFPDPSLYKLYCEPCGGAGHVFLARPRYHHAEVFSDLENNLITFWLQAQGNAAELEQRLLSLPYSRALYYQWYRSLFDGTELSDLERAVRYFYVLRGTGTGWIRRSPVGWNCLPSSARSFNSAIDLLSAIQERMRGVVIDNRDVLATIRRYDDESTLFYLDPPYIENEEYYEVCLKNGFPHEELAALLQEVKGYVSLSYYEHSNLEHWYPSPKWRRTRWTQRKNSDIQTGQSGQGQELLLTNYDPPVLEPTLW